MKSNSETLRGACWVFFYINPPHKDTKNSWEYQIIYLKVINRHYVTPLYYVNNFVNNVLITFLVSFCHIAAMLGLLITFWDTQSGLTRCHMGVLQSVKNFLWVKFVFFTKDSYRLTPFYPNSSTYTCYLSELPTYGILLPL